MTTVNRSSGPSAATRARIVEAALSTLKREGFSGASARAIARTGDFNQALIFYHFGSVKNLLLAALDQTSAARMEQYRRGVAEAETLEDLVAVAGQIYREDVEAGHITVLSEMIGGCLSHPELRAEVLARMEPWIDFCEDAITRVVRDSDLARFLPIRDLAYAIASFYLGVNLLTHLDGDRTRVESLFGAAARLAPVLSPIFGPRPD